MLNVNLSLWIKALNINYFPYHKDLCIYHRKSLHIHDLVVNIFANGQTIMPPNWVDLKKTFSLESSTELNQNDDCSENISSRYL